MKIRHVRAIAIFGIAVVALTGARGSGGGCSSSSSSSSSSDSDSGGASGTSGSSTTGGSVTGGSKADAARDLTIEACEYDETAGFSAEVTASNTDGETYDYTFTVEFTDASGITLASGPGSLSDITAGSTESVNVTAADTAGDGGDAGGQCEVVDATRTTV
ncbi:hypothetical protein [Streptomyces sp. NBC_01508]|uniref:hypothetical protein n=1 Tax=Streptomyces sp. NBC_01508 TaxID=2903888 RepID=UPI00386C962A